MIKSRENKLPPTKIPQKFNRSFFTLLNFNEIGCKQCNENDQMASVFCYFQILYMKTMNIREKLFPRVKFANFFPQNLKNPKSVKLNSHKDIYHTVSGDVEIVDDFVYRAI